MEKQQEFIAVQCVQCSTMQVKQQRRSGSKWSCAVCNQKHSVLRVFARGPLAKDIRLFVQRFNISRAPSDAVLIPEPPSEDACGGHRKRRMDWTEYLDPEAAEEEETSPVDSVTELPKMKASKYARKPGPIAEDSRLLRPSFSKRKKQAVFRETGESKQVGSTACSSSKWSKYMERDIEEEEEVGSPDGALWGDEEGGVRVDEEVHPEFI